MSYLRFFRYVSGVIFSLLVGASFALEPPVSDVSAASQSTALSGSTNTNTNDAEPEQAQEQDLLVSSTSQLSLFRLGRAKGEWLGLLQQHVPELTASAEAQSLTPGVLRKLRNAINSLLSTEGYFSPVIGFEKKTANASIILVNVDAGPRTLIQNVNLTFTGALADAVKLGQVAAVERRDSLVANWSLSTAEPFRDSEWVRAKTQLSESLRSDSYAAASIIDSSAAIDADNHTAILAVEADSGPAFVLGEMTVSGLQRYPLALLERFNPPKKGEPYSRTRLLDYQRALQNSAYFSTVAVSVEPDPAKADAIPVEVNVVERKARDLALGVGYSTNTGFRTEILYRDRNVLEKAWDLHSAVRFEQKRQLAYADIYLPPLERDQLDSVGVLFDSVDVSGLSQTRTAIGVKRTNTRGHLEQRFGINLTLEKNQLDGERERFSRALVGTVGWTWRDVDNSFAPRKGQIAQADVAVSDKALVSDQRFIRLYGKYQRWIPVAKQDSIVLRAEAGKMFSESISGIPEDYLFRTGGSTTVRGYAYQSLGIQHAGGVSGGSVMAIGSAEYVHWFEGNLGGAAFVDIGDAADSWRNFNAKQGFGLGARYKTPAGPIALDLAYGKQVKKFRLDFSIAIAF